MMGLIKRASTRTPSYQKRTIITTLVLAIILLLIQLHGLLRFHSLDSYYYYDYTFSANFEPGQDGRFSPVPLVVHVTPSSALFTLANVTTLASNDDDDEEDDPPRWITKRKNKFWRHGEVHEHRMVEQLPEGCVPEAEWMNDTHPSCNLLHQIDLNDFFFNDKRTAISVNGNKRRKQVRYVGGGGFRSAFMFHEYDGTRRVLKTLLYDEDRNFVPRMVDRMRKDAVVTEQLSSSPYIANTWGYCAQASVVDYSNEPDMLFLFRQKKKPSKDELFQHAHDVAQSVADAHHFNEHGRATIVHMDIKPNQWIWLDNGYKLNDFNCARFLSWDPVKKKNCHHASGYSEGRWQAPEQFHEQYPRTEKADTFALGYVLNFLLTGEKPFPDLKGAKVQEIVEKGAEWRISDPKILNSTHPFDIAVRKASEMCLVFDPDKRPNAQEVADVIRVALEDYKKSKS